MNIIRKFLRKYVYQDWNIGIADIADDLSPINIQWMKHNYKDRWFADPFILEETDDSYVILAEECMHEQQKGRLARLTVDKKECRLIKNETILELPTHLSFPNIIRIGNDVMVYPENAGGGNTKIYKYGASLKYQGVLSRLPLADAVIAKFADSYYIFATIGENCNGNLLQVYKSQKPLGDYTAFSEIQFPDNIARRAGNLFEFNNSLISPAQVCNKAYGEGVSLQRVELNNGIFEFTEIKRMYPPTKAYPEGFHTFNVFGNKVVIDGYRYGSKFLHDLYFKVRK